MPQRFSTRGCCSCVGWCAAPVRAGISLRATGAWELTPLWEAWRGGGLEAVYAAMDATERAATEQAEAVEAAHQEQVSRGAVGCWCTRRASGSRPTPTPGRPGEDVRGSHRLGQGAVVPDPAGGAAHPTAQALALQPRQLLARRATRDRRPCQHSKPHPLGPDRH